MLKKQTKKSYNVGITTHVCFNATVICTVFEAVKATYNRKIVVNNVIPAIIASNPNSQNLQRPSYSIWFQRDDAPPY